MPSLYIRVHFVSIFEIKQGIFAFMSEFVNVKYEHMKSLKSTENKRKNKEILLQKDFSAWCLVGDSNP